jgi:hypothetical protein
MFVPPSKIPRGLLQEVDKKAPVRSEDAYGSMTLHIVYPPMVESLDGDLILLLAGFRIRTISDRVIHPR